MTLARAAVLRPGDWVQYARRGVIVSGASGTGKTTALTQLGRTHERHIRKRQPEDKHRLPVLYATVLPAATARMLAVEFARFLGLQFTGRFTLIPATAFAYGTTEQREQWRALVATMESTIRLHKHRHGSLVALDEYLYRRSGGMIGSLAQLIRGAAILAIEDGREQITRDLLDIVPVDYAAERADTTRTSRRSGSGKRAAS